MLKKINVRVWLAKLAGLFIFERMSALEKMTRVRWIVPPQSHERLCWSTWPCAACSKGVTPIGHLLAGIKSGAFLRHGNPEEIALAQTAFLKAWVDACPHLRQTEAFLPRLAAGSEHLVFFDEKSASVIKCTRPNTFGESYYLVDGIVHQRNCSPLDYLLRLRLWKKLFQSAPKDLGITSIGQIVSSHEFISGTLPTQSAVDDFLERSGLIAVRQNCWLWKKTYPEEFLEVWVGDARNDNFVQSSAGMVPIDIRMWFTPLTD